MFNRIELKTRHFGFNINIVNGYVLKCSMIAYRLLHKQFINNN